MTDYTLYHGEHDASDGRRCAMEWVAYLAGEKHSDNPVCVDQRLGDFFVTLNDGLDYERRQLLRPYLARTIGTAGDGMREQREALIRSLTGGSICRCTACAVDVLRQRGDAAMREFLDRLLPTVPLQLPVAEDAAAVCAVAA